LFELIEVFAIVSAEPVAAECQVRHDDEHYQQEKKSCIALLHLVGVVDVVVLVDVVVVWWSVFQTEKKRNEK